jgi:hypothetical protein
MRHFTIEQLNSERLADAWPLVRIAAAHANSDWWLTEASTLIMRGGGVLAARASSGAIHGIATYEVTKGFGRPRMFEVSTLFTIELTGHARAKRMLCNAIYSLAATMDCDGVVLPRRGSEPPREA